MPVNVIHAKKGAGEPIRGTIAQGSYNVALWKVPGVAEALSKRGWTAPKTETLEADVRELERRNAARQTKKTGAKANTKTERQARSDAKAFKRTLDLAFADVVATALVEGRELPVTSDAFEVGRTIGKSTPVLVEYLGRIRGSVEALKDELAPYFEGEDPVAKLDAVKNTLAAADATQEVSIVQLPLATQELYEIKGRVIAAVEKQNRIGKIAFAGEAEKIAMFNKDILLRARRTEHDTGEGDPQI